MKGNEFAESSGSQSGIPGGAASMSPGNDMLDMQILGLHPSPTESETLLTALQGILTQAQVWESLS